MDEPFTLILAHHFHFELLPFVNAYTPTYLLVCVKFPRPPFEIRAASATSYAREASSSSLKCPNERFVLDSVMDASHTPNRVSHVTPTQADALSFKRTDDTGGNAPGVSDTNVVAASKLHARTPSRPLLRTSESYLRAAATSLANSPNDSFVKSFASTINDRHFWLARSHSTPQCWK